MRGEAEPTWCTCSSALGSRAMKSARSGRWSVVDGRQACQRALTSRRRSVSRLSTMSETERALERLAVDEHGRRALHARLGRRRVGGVDERGVVGLLHRVEHRAVGDAGLLGPGRELVARRACSGPARRAGCRRAGRGSFSACSGVPFWSTAAQAVSARGRVVVLEQVERAGTRPARVPLLGRVSRKSRGASRTGGSRGTGSPRRRPPWSRPSRWCRSPAPARCAVAGGSAAAGSGVVLPPPEKHDHGRRSRPRAPPRSPR